MGLIREARLRPEYGHLYPGLAAGEWVPASDLGARMLLGQLSSGTRPRLGERLLPDLHFEFRGGPNRVSRTERTRAGDPGEAEISRH